MASSDLATHKLISRAPILRFHNTPRSPDNSIFLRALFSSEDGLFMPGSIQKLLPPLQDSLRSDIQDLLLQKIRLCCTLFDFTRPAKDATQKQAKRDTLIEIKDYVRAHTRTLTETITSSLFKMIALNIFRTFPPDYHDDAVARDHAIEPSWSHLELIYDILQIYVDEMHEVKHSMVYIDELFVASMLELFDSPYVSERKCLKIILHHIYAKFVRHRSYIRNAVKNIFYQFTMETHTHNGIAELLEIYGSIISGFSVPLKQEHTVFMARALIPLYKPNCLGKYFEQLSHCATRFILKDSTLTDVLIKGLLRYWPKTHSINEVLFLQQVEALLDIIGPQEFQSCMVPLFRQLARCLSSAQFLVAEQTLLLWRNDHVANLITQNRREILPLIIGALERNMSTHWSSVVNELTSDVRKMFVIWDNELFQECLENYRAKEGSENAVHESRRARWKQLEKLAHSRSLHLQQAQEA